MPDCTVLLCHLGLPRVSRACSYSAASFPVLKSAGGTTQGRRFKSKLHLFMLLRVTWTVTGTSSIAVPPHFSFLKTHWRTGTTLRKKVWRKKTLAANFAQIGKERKLYINSIHLVSLLYVHILTCGSLSVARNTYRPRCFSSMSRIVVVT